MTETVMGKRLVEVFTAGCALCDETVALVQRLACASCEVRVLDMHEPRVAERARTLGVTGVPAVAVDGRLAECCDRGGPTEADLRAAGIGRPVA